MQSSVPVQSMATPIEGGIVNKKTKRRDYQAQSFRTMKEEKGGGSSLWIGRARPLKKQNI